MNCDVDTALPLNRICPQAEVQLCINHPLRNAIKYQTSKHHNIFITDLKPVLRVVSKDAAVSAPEEPEAQ